MTESRPISGKKVTTEEFKIIALDILKDFDVVCRNHSIKYSIAYGTMLGAVRHKGFIPWDDDIDVIMVRDEYNKFLTVCHEMKEFHRFISVETDTLFSAPLAKIYDTNTILKETLHNDNIKIGVYIDVFVFDYLPDNMVFRKVQSKIARVLNRMWGLSVYSCKSNSLLEKGTRAVARKLFLGKKATRFLVKMLNRNKSSAKEIGDLLYLCYPTLDIETFQREEVTTYTLYEFENSFFYGFKNYDLFLKRWYGDYMALPPLEQRVVHHTYEVYYQ